MERTAFDYVANTQRYGQGMLAMDYGRPHRTRSEDNPISEIEHPRAALIPVTIRSQQRHNLPGFARKVVITGALLTAGYLVSRWLASSRTRQPKTFSNTRAGSTSGATPRPPDVRNRNKAYGVQVFAAGGNPVPVAVVARSERDAELVASTLAKGGHTETLRQLSDQEVAIYGLDILRHGDARSLPALNL